MRITKGNSRIVIIFHCIVIKFPIIRLRLGLRMLWGELKSGTLIEHFRECDHEQFGTIPHFLFRGILNNWLEFVFYQKNKSLLLLAPTHFSLLGFLNVQKHCEPIPMEDADLWCQLVEMVGELVWKDSHAFSNAKNFGVIKQKLKMVDYGSTGSQEVLKECAEKVFSNFDFSYSREKRKKQLFPEE